MMMAMRRVCWALWLLMACVLHLFGNNVGTFAVLAASVLVPVLLAWLAWFSAHGLRAEFSLPAHGEKNREIAGVLSVRNAGPWPMQKVVCRVICANGLTGEALSHEMVFGLAAKCAMEVPIAARVAHCGRLTMIVTDLRVMDAFGLFARRVPFCAEESVWIWPEGFAMDVTLAAHMSAAVDSERYSMTQPGYDPSETYAIREYIPGDPIKSIHWKLSQKADTLLTRELGLPVVSRMLVLMETTILADYGAVPFAAMDAMVEVFAAVSRALCEVGTAHTLGWKDMETGLFREMAVENEDDIASAMEAVLANPFGAGEMTVASCFRSKHALCAYAHVVVVSPYATPDLAQLCNGNRVTVLECGGDVARDGMQADGTFGISFSANDYARELGGLEL